MPYMLIIGAGSDIARYLARRFAEAGYSLYLAGRDVTALEKDAEDLKIRYQVEARALAFDVLDYESHRKFYEGLEPGPYGIVLAVGYLGEQLKAERDWDETRLIIETNFTGPVSICNIAAQDLEQRKRGCVIGISSVAGERGRRSNYMYGSAKAGFTTYLSGLRGRLSRAGVQVLTVKPGFVRTRMTAGLDLPEKLMAEPREAALDIFQAWKEGKDETYTKWFWKYIMMVIRNIPECFFKKMDI